MRSTRDRLEDILHFSNQIRDHLPMDRLAYDSDIVIRYFLMKHVEIIGEAVFKLDSKFKLSHPDVPWKKVEGARHILVHDYFDVDWGVLWDILQWHIDPLRLQVEAILHDFSEA